MPELDPDLTRILTLSLLGVIAILLLLVLSSLGRARKEITEALRDLRPAPSEYAADAAPADAGPEEVAPAQAQMVQAEPARAEPEPEPIRAAAPAEASPAPVAVAEGVEPAAREPEPAAAREPEPAAVREPEPAAVREPEPEPAAVQATSAQAEEPEEQPFERDGRWWFRRGDELLVYDEATGQWVASPQDAAPAAAPQPAGAMATTISGISGASQVAQQREPEAASEPEAATGFWKCPSCGAVNGSTSSSCRMCFAARP